MPFEVSKLPAVPAATAEIVAPAPTNAPVAVVSPVPPLATGKVPVTPVERGNPVALVSVADEGVPNAPPACNLSVFRFVKLVSTSVLVNGEPLPARVTIVDI